jgi:hypothetical protein
MGQQSARRPWPRLLADGGAGYLVSTDGTEMETSPAVIYDPASGMISPETMAASHLKMLNGYSERFTLPGEERAKVEAEVARLLGWTSVRE